MNPLTLRFTDPNVEKNYRSTNRTYVIDSLLLCFKLEILLIIIVLIFNFIRLGVSTLRLIVLKFVISFLFFFDKKVHKTSDDRVFINNILFSFRFHDIRINIQHKNLRLRISNSIDFQIFKPSILFSVDTIGKGSVVLYFNGLCCKYLLYTISSYRS